MVDLNAQLNKELGIKDPVNDPSQTIPAEDNNKISTTRSVLSGLASGVFKIPEGFASLGASLIDLGLGTKSAESVEKFFADVNPFDEAAEATTAGKITELVVNLGIPGGYAFKLGSNLAKEALLAKKSGKYLDITGDIAGGLKNTDKLNKTGKAIQFGSGAITGGLAEAAAVADVEEAGTFGDWLGGPTKLERKEEYDADTELLNRAKFGLEGSLFTGVLGAAGIGIKKLRNQTDTGKVINGELNKFIDKWISQPLRARGKMTQEQFDLYNKMEGNVAADLNRAQNAAFDIDNKIDKLFPFFKRTFGDKTVAKERSELLSEMNDILFSSEKGSSLTPSFNMIDEIDLTTGNKTGKQLLDVNFGKINPIKQENFQNKLINKYKADAADVNSIFENINGIRSDWENLFSSMGRRLDDEGLNTFKDIMSKKVTTWMDSGYEVFKNNPINPINNYRPAKAVIDDTVKQFQDIAKESGVNISPEQALSMVNEVITTAKLPKNFKLNEILDVSFNLPNFFVKNSLADEALKVTNKKISELSGTNLEVINNLLGKNNNALSTIIESTNRLSSIVRRNEMFDNLLNTSNKMREVGKVPTFADSAEEARELFGGISSDWRMIGAKKSIRGVEGLEKIDPTLDYKKTLKPLKGELQPYRIVDGESRQVPILNPLEGKFALNNVVDALENVDNSVLGNDFISQLYRNLILYPKATSQMAKTVLGPITHVRNFISAGAFAAANGILPFSDTEAVKKAYDALQVYKPFKSRTKGGNELYQELQRLGVVNSSVTQGDLERLLKDVNFGSTISSIRAFDGAFKNLSKIKQFAQDAYTAEDDFWKIFSWFGEKSRLEKAYKNAGLRLGQEFTDAAGNIKIFNDDFLKEEAANLVKNNIPNYAYVSGFVKGLRQLPVGNFVSFPAEILRTSTNIVQRGLDEFFYTTTINGKQVNPLRSIGLQRLIGMGVTTAAVPAAVVEAASAIYDVSREEIEAARRYVAKWSKNSTLVPTRDKDGNLEIIDFSHLNAYDTLVRPIQTVINSVQSGDTDKEGIMSNFILGLIESTKEIGEPFITESIWTTALQDISPILGRGGVSIDGKEIWNPKDTTGNKMYKALGHLVESQAPFNWKQLERLYLTSKPINDEGRFDEYGRQYELGNELLGIAGLRSIKVDPAKSINFKITNYKEGIRNSRSLFTSETLKGGPISSKEIVDAYINANRATFETRRELYKDVEAAKILGMNEDSIAEKMKNRGESVTYRNISQGIFKPLDISKDVKDLFRIRAEELGLPNTFEQSQDVIDAIREFLSNVPLSQGDFPDIENPFNNLPAQPTLNPSGQLPPAVLGADVISVANSLNQNLVGGVNPQTTQLIQQSNALDSFIRGR
jgi:hypothetical protein